MLYPLPANVPWAALLISLAFVVGMSLGAWRARWQAPSLLVGWCWYLGVLFPVSGLPDQGGAQSWADRYTYLPSIGLLAALLWAVGAVLARWPRSRPLLAVGALAAALALAAVSRAQIGLWHDDVTLWERAVAVTGDNYVAQINLGSALSGRGDRVGALSHYREAARIAPTSMEAQAGLGSALMEMGLPAEAVPHLEAAVRLRPDDPRPRVSLAGALADLGQRERAIQELREALRLAPNLPPALAGLRELGAEPAPSTTAGPAPPR